MLVPAASWARTTSAIAAATSAGPYDAPSASTRRAAVHPSASALRSCSTASEEPSVSTVAWPPVSFAVLIASSTAQSS